LEGDGVSDLKKLYFFVDAISEGVAVLMTGDGSSFTVSAPALPDGVREGDWLAASLEIDVSKKNESIRAVERLYEDLGDAP
jgi:hypothetical protein